MRLWKILGMAGLAGVAAGGVVLARGERERRAYTPDDVRDRLRARAAAAPDQDEPPPAEVAPIRPGTRHRATPLQRLRRRMARLRAGRRDRAPAPGVTRLPVGERRPRP